ncbi:MAG TPA: LysR family transcriptional regulator [Polyangiaceae bacterium]|nr:LysR family transcriptional regulator [Polyangiaceae bacterium]
MPAHSELDWDLLRYFLEAARAQTLAGAARKLGTEHTTIGRRLAALERALGAALVLRGPDGLRLTALGEQLVPIAEQMERSVQSLRDLAERGVARVRLAVPSGFARLFVAELGALRERHPGLLLEIVSGARLVDLEQSEADLALRGAPIDQSDLIARRLCESGWSLYAASSYLERRAAPGNLADLSGHDLIGFHPSLGQLPAAQWLEQRAAPGSVVLRSREMTDMVAAASSGLGLGVLPCVLADVEPGLVRLTSQVLATRTLSLVYRREMRLSAPVSAVIDFVFDVIRANANLIEGTRAPDGPRA